MAITLADFTKIWASTSPLTPYSFSDSNYQEGWNFVGATPPARQMWDSIQKNNDEKLKYIVDNFLPLSGGTMTGDINYINGDSQTFGVGFSDANEDNVDIGWTFEDRTGAGIGLRSKEHTEAGGFDIWTDDGTNRKVLLGKPDGTFSWDGNNVITSAGGTMTGTIVTTAHPAIKHANNNNTITFVGGSGTGGGDGAKIILVGGSASSNTGNFTIQAGGLFGSTTKYTALIGKPDGTLTWDGKTVIVGNQYTQTFSNVSVNANANKLVGQLDYNPTYYSVKIDGTGYADISAMVNTTNRNLYIRNLGSSNLSSLNVVVNYIVL